MRGIDISNWQGNIVPSKLGIDFCIIKATEGISFVDPYCDKNVQDCIKNKIPFGFYHFAANTGTAEKEARHFYSNCKNYFGIGIPILDFEINTDNNAKWADEFCKWIYTRTGVYPLFYTYASGLSAYKESWISKHCGLWLAGYPKTYTTWTKDKMPYDPSPWKSAAIWQFTSSLKLTGYEGNLDGDIAYMDKTAWGKYVKPINASNPSEPIQPILNVTDAIKKVLQGEYGTGETRIKKLTAQGYDAEFIQAKIDDYYNVAYDVINGKWGNGWNRKTALNGAGYDYDIVQSIVNALMKG